MTAITTTITIMSRFHSTRVCGCSCANYREKPNIALELCRYIGSRSRQGLELDFYDTNAITQLRFSLRKSYNIARKFCLQRLLQKFLSRNQVDDVITDRDDIRRFCRFTQKGARFCSADGLTRPVINYTAEFDIFVAVDSCENGTHIRSSRAHQWLSTAIVHARARIKRNSDVTLLSLSPSLPTS